jgi:hypothetical protein
MRLTMRGDPDMPQGMEMLVVSKSAVNLGWHLHDDGMRQLAASFGKRTAAHR